MEDNIEIYDLKCDYGKEIIGLGNKKPLFSWKIRSNHKNFKQKAYRIMASSNKEYLDNNKFDMWDSGVVVSDKQYTNYQGVELESRDVCYFKIIIYDHDDNMAISKGSFFEMGLLKEEDWIGEFIGMGEKALPAWSPIFRIEKKFKKDIIKARGYICGLGYNELYINGSKIGDSVLNPEQTDYEKRIFYSTYVLDDYIKEGNNAFGVMLGSGFYNQNTVWNKDMNYGEPLFICQIEVTYKDGSKDYLISSKDWHCQLGPITRNNVYTGEVYDKRLEKKNFSKVGHDINTWQKASVMKGPKGKLIAKEIEPVKKMEEYSPIEIKEPRTGIYVADFSKNMAGHVKINFENLQAGSEINITYAETVYENGMINTDSGGAQFVLMPHIERFISNGEKKESFEAKFTYTGFRYVQIQGLNKPLEQKDIKAYAVYTSWEKKSSFKTSDETLNTMQKMMENSVKSNVQGIISDCPIREKCGWLGDATIICDTTLYNWDAVRFWRKYLRDIRTTKEINGEWMQIAPGRRLCGKASPAWGMAQVYIPYLIYWFYDNKEILKENYDLIIKWVYHLKDRSKKNLVSFGLGDWACPLTVGDNHTAPELISSACYFLSVKYAKEIAKILGDLEEFEKLSLLEKNIKKSFNEAYYDENEGSYSSQTANSYALYLGLNENGQENRIVKSIVKDIENRKYHLTCGHIGVRYVFNALSKYGYGDVAMKVIREKTYPGFRHQIECGATTLWETYEADDPKIDFGINGARSLNHPFKGGYGQWFFSDLLGIKAKKPGFKEISIIPDFKTNLKLAEGTYRSIYGDITVEYIRKDNRIFAKVVIPPNTKAEFVLADKNLYINKSGEKLRKVKLSNGDNEFLVEGD